MKTIRVLSALALAAVLPSTAIAAGGGAKIDDTQFSFEGPFGTFDRMQLQRGFQIFHEVCAGCHGMRYVSFRELGNEDGPAFPPEQVKAIAALYEVPDLEGEPGDTREGRPADRFPVNDGVGAPDLSLMAKARAGFHGPAGTGLNQLLKGMGGAEYIAALMSGYVDEPECAAEAEMDGYYNNAFTAGAYPDSCKIWEETEIPVLDENGDQVMGEDGAPKVKIERVEIGRQVEGSWIGMAPPLNEEDEPVEYALYSGNGENGGEGEIPEPTNAQMSADIAAFLAWAAEPTMMQRKSAGFRNFVMILVLAVLLYYTNKALWASIKRK